MPSSINPPTNQALVEAALHYASRNWHVFPIKPRGKIPLTKHGFKDATSDRAQIEKWWAAHPTANIGIATGASGLVVLDVDGEEGRQELKTLLEQLGVQLPRTLCTKTGRKGGLHAFYRGAVPSSQVKGEHLDVRGTTGYVVAAPSVHENGNVYQWVDAAALVEEVPEWVGAWVSRRRGTGSLATSAPLSTSEPPKAPSTGRVELPLYLANGPRRQVATSLIAAMGSTPHTAYEAARVRSALACIDPSIDGKTWFSIGAALHDLNWIINETDQGFEIWDEWSSKSEGKGAGQGEYKGRENLAKRWESFKKNVEGPRAGLGTVFALAKANGWNELTAVPHVNGEATKLPEQLTKSTPSNPLIELNERFAVISDLGGKCLVMGMVKSKVDESLKVPSFQTFKSFSERYAHRYIMVEREGAKGEVIEEPKQIGSYWLKWTNRRSFEGLDLVPGGGEVLPGQVLNLWTGFGVVPQTGAWPLMRAHVESVLASGDVASAVYIMKYAAWCVQNPGERAEVALCFRGEKGSGKGTFANALRRIFGQHGLHIFNSKHLVGAFNGHLRNCLLLFADEAFWAGDKQGESVLKGMITEPALMIEQKGVDAAPWKNRLHVIMAANAEWVVPAGHQERRYAVFDVSAARVGDFAYFKALHAELSEGGLAAMLHDLLKVKLVGWHPRDIPQTEALRNQKELSLSPLDGWWEELLQTGILPFQLTGKIGVARSNTMLQHVRDSLGQIREANAQTLARFLRKKGCTRYEDSKTSLWQLPALDTARQRWDKETRGWRWEASLTKWSQ